jgi:hypothetical protein
MSKAQICAASGCQSPARARGWCKKHYTRWQRHGAPSFSMRGRPKRFFDKSVLQYSGQECLFWPFGRNSMGYATIHVDGKKQYVHRLACERIHGSPPSEKHEAAHCCGHGAKGCVNPWHLRWATSAENSADTLKHGTRNRGCRNGKAVLSENDVRAIRKMHGTETHNEIARAFGVSQQHVTAIILRRKWGHVQ